MEQNGKKTLEYEMVVLGAGIAGCMAALCLSRAGVKTLVVEKKVYSLTFLVPPFSSHKKLNGSLLLENLMNFIIL